ncbi:potassium transporter Kup [Sphingomicrobium lutaoense]|uniref:Probable potassium transport system protein Kup n=1 Tax=Sphingomicrobium lutaoense TaxID=515949 RepID=A0A839YTD4_9SPHN|nr:potassium transporter Kup [Sphingomicrobium lutaoense]MBB3763531.1 KUP system potassium uptake protein [Sphingomicrobium lutaoense]
MAEAGGHRSSASTAKLAAGAVGIVFGDIGTSPIYAFRETFAGHHTLVPDALHVYGVLSLIFWSMMIIVTLKYVTIIMRADNRGEGGSLALLALYTRQGGGARWTKGIILLGVFATSLFYGDSMITPAISVLSAVEGLSTVNPAFSPLVIPLAVVILVALFSVQRFGTAGIARFFAPVMLTYFFVLALLGLAHIPNHLPVLWEMLNPLNATHFLGTEPYRAFFALGSVVLAVTGAEALYADMGHFGRKPIRLSWLWIVMPALLLNYLGQGALLLSHDPASAQKLVQNPFFYLAPDLLRLPLVILATLATVIASQAVISGAFSVTQQAIQLGFMPRLRIEHTSEDAAGQIYVPVINWLLLVAVILLVLTFRSSSNLSAAYGIAVTGAMLIDTILISVILLSLWKWRKSLVIPLLALFFTVDILYFGANLLKVPEGGWVPLLIGALVFTLLTTWAKGRQRLLRYFSREVLPVELFARTGAKTALRVPGTAVFLTTSTAGVPPSLLHNLKHNKVLHERTFLLTVKIADVPRVPDDERTEVESYGSGIYRVILNYGFMDHIHVPRALARLDGGGGPCKVMETSYFLGRQTLLPSRGKWMHRWQEQLFASMMRNSESAMTYFRLPPNRVVELGSQVKI